MWFFELINIDKSLVEPKKLRENPHEATVSGVYIYEPPACSDKNVYSVSGKGASTAYHVPAPIVGLVLKCCVLTRRIISGRCSKSNIKPVPTVDTIYCHGQIDKFFF